MEIVELIKKKHTSYTKMSKKSWNWLGKHKMRSISVSGMTQSISIGNPPHSGQTSVQTRLRKRVQRLDSKQVKTLPVAVKK